MTWGQCRWSFLSSILATSSGVPPSPPSPKGTGGEVAEGASSQSHKLALKYFCQKKPKSQKEGLATQALKTFIFENKEGLAGLEDFRINWKPEQGLLKQGFSDSFL